MQPFRTDFQITAFLYLLYGGFFLGLIYDLTSLFLHRIPAFFRLPTDIVLALLTAAVLFIAIYSSGAAALRFYMFPGVATGVLLYRAGPASVIKKAAQHLTSKRNSDGNGE